MSEKIDEILEEQFVIDDEEQKQMNKKIQRGIAKKIYTKILITILILSCLVYGGYNGYQHYLDTNSFHLEDLEQLVTVKDYFGHSTKEQVVAQNTGFYLHAYCELFFPGYVFEYYGNAEDISRTDYGKYEVRSILLNYFHVNTEKHSMGFQNLIYETVKMNINDGKMSLSYEDIMRIKGNDLFQIWWNYGDTYKEKYSVPAISDELETFPDSAYIELDMRFKEPLSLEDVFLFQTEYPDSRLAYGVTHQIQLPEVYSGKYTIGMSFLFGNYAFPSQEAMEKYPWLFMTSFMIDEYDTTNRWINQFGSEGARKINAKHYLEHYKNVVSLLVDNDVLTEPEKTIAETLKEELQGDSVMISGVRMFCTKKDVLALLEDERIADMHIEDVKMSRFE